MHFVKSPKRSREGLRPLSDPLNGGPSCGSRNLGVRDKDFEGGSRSRLRGERF